MQPGDFFKRLTGQSVSRFHTLSAIDRAVEQATGQQLIITLGGVEPVDAKTTKGDIDRSIGKALKGMSALRRCTKC
jgi:hypothetical protein